ncbi:ornithine carbamoyltransferase [Microbacterium sp. SORGH_AS428]|uniref:ornithine carbamoyltransferase n=1 Tax=Microbacterium sp. SORGH_AS_0428 TaxID=3041788 RepID=UPI00285A0B02|nr:ornithine carbamoyltransferase [Microbacterium sp. SORGH_AS_0428]MDR6199814.1 ornithine carbamoyltransferase [Microbacterium sp. SORGH_AS_0428]
MRSLIRLDDWTSTDIEQVFALADAYGTGRGPKTSGCAVMFFPATSLRTRVTFERGAALMGLQPVVLPESTLDKPEAHADVANYLAGWADLVVARHGDIGVLEALADPGALPIVNAMTSTNHPCEILADLWMLRQNRDLAATRFLFVGPDGNISRAWQEASRALGLDLVQCSPSELRTPGARWVEDLATAIRSADVIVTDDPADHARILEPYRITASLLDAASRGVQLNPCPPFIRGREVSEDAVAHPAFVGHAFKRALLPVHQAVMASCLGLG